MRYPSRTNQELLEENASLKQRVRELEQSETERKQMLEELDIARNRLSKAEIISRSGNWEFDLESKRVFASDGARKVYGLQNLEWTIPDVQKIPFPEDRGLLDQALRDLINENRPYDVEFRICRPDTGEIAHIRSVAEYDRQRNVVFGILQDITERKRIEEELKQYRDHLEALVKERTIQLMESENKYRAIFENTGNATLIFEEDTTISLVNAEFEDLFHYTREETEAKKSWTELVLKEDLERLMEYHRMRRIDPDAVPKEYELKVVDRNGFIHNVYMTVAIIPGTKKSVASITDITPLKEVEKALRESETHYRALFDHAGVGIVHVDAQGNFLRVNKNFEEFLGYTREELENMNATQGITHPDYIEQTRERITKQISGEIDQFSQEKYYIRKDGTLRWGAMRSTPIRDEQGRLLSAVVAIIDRTIQKQADDELRKYAEEITDLYENAPCGYHSLGEDGMILRMNNTALSWLGYSRDEVVGKMKITEFLTPEGREVFYKRFSLVKTQGSLSDIEGKWIRKDGTILDVLINANAIFDENGNYLMSRDSVINNTELKKAKDALEKSEAMYRNLFENASIGMFQSTLEGRFLRINKAYSTMLGYETPGEVISVITDTGTQIHANPGNRAELLAALKQSGWFYAEQPYIRKDGSIMIGQLAVRKVVSQDGTTAYLEGIVEDITERKQAEEALIKSERGLRIQAQDLREVNTTMKVLLNTMEKDQENLKERFLVNIKEQVLPYLEKLNKTPLTNVQKGFIEKAEYYLGEIASPFVQKLTSSYLNLTKKEIQIATLVKEGKSSKEIAELLHAKQRVIEFHRENIRAKLGLKNKKVRLSILLRSFS